MRLLGSLLDKVGLGGLEDYLVGPTAGMMFPGMGSAGGGNAGIPGIGGVGGGGGVPGVSLPGSTGIQLPSGLGGFGGFGGIGSIPGTGGNNAGIPGIGGVGGGGGFPGVPLPGGGGGVPVFQNGDVSGSVGVGVGSNGLSVLPRLQIGQGEYAELGGNLGGVGGAAAGAVYGPVGAAVGSFVGSAAGSGIGSLFDKDSKKHPETKARNEVLDKYRESGLLGEGNSITSPDGTTFNFMEGGNPNDKGRRDYEIDFEKDLDYTAGMAGITLSRLVAGSSNKSIDQVGNGFGNAFLGSAGSGAEFNPSNFNTVMGNARAQYAKAGIKTKEEMLAMANTMFSEGRINDFDYTVMQQTANLVFDNDYNTASKLMAGRNQGTVIAGETPSNSSAPPQAPASNQAPPSGGAGTNTGQAYPNIPSQPGYIPPGYKYPIISLQEAMLSVKPLVDARRGGGGQGVGIDLGNLTQIGTQIRQGYDFLNRITGGKIDDWLKGGLYQLGDYLGIPIPGNDIVGGIQINDNPSGIPSVGPSYTDDGFSIGDIGLGESGGIDSGGFFEDFATSDLGIF